MSTYLLVHGSFHGGWAWEKVAPLLEQRGHRGIAHDLPGHGRDATPLAGLTLASYVESVCRVLDAEREPVVLVAHSMGGVVATQAAELRPEKVRALAYVCAFLPRNGQSLLDIGKTDAESLLVKNLVIDEQAGLHWILEDAVREALYGDCSDDDVARARARLVREPLAPVATPVSVTAQRFGRVPRVYIECTEDRGLSLSVQRRMVAETPCDRVVSLRSSHSPFFSVPTELTDHLASI